MKAKEEHNLRTLYNSCTGITCYIIKERADKYLRMNKEFVNLDKK